MSWVPSGNKLCISGHASYRRYKITILLSFTAYGSKWQTYKLSYIRTFSQNISSHPKSTSGSLSSSLSLAHTVPFPEYAGLLHCKIVRTKSCLT